MPNFYFTYGTEGQPFFGGWTEVDAPSLGLLRIPRLSPGQDRGLAELFQRL